ncbi:uncharacterized protein VP01_827g6 [Puccinia sorghi]|uniref:Uncharacterized protein n=1 Tax=Puccinia sorghi TaxID=27349 RepID=A0A0L6U9S4_9BASI|nr:uncharacterized protein VP01_827g6 [Puccinia sorghi]
MPPQTRSMANKVAIDMDSPALSKFLSNPNSYVSYVSPQLLSDGTNISAWLDSLDDLAILVFGVRRFCAEQSNFQLLTSTMDRSLLHVVKSTIAMDLKPIVKDSLLAWEAIEVLRKNFHKSVRSRQLELLSNLIHLDSTPNAAHFNRFFSTIRTSASGSDCAA